MVAAKHPVAARAGARMFELGGNAGRRRDSFTSLDVNRNGTISRDEWHWSRRSFDDQDIDRDGVLTRREFNGGAVPTTGRD